ncbi:MAG: DUF948 domain-containing protein [Candidatus Symbiothrix sp.]|jgi:cell division protein FtsB|nr:DUF948 domain-containing protein [Candidatus Symbiothrix sp.]
MKKLSLFLLLISCFASGQSDNNAILKFVFPTLSDLDKIVADQRKYTDRYEAQIDTLKQELKKARSEAERYKIKGRLFDKYTYFVVDSALYYAQEKLISAQKLKRDDYMADSRMNTAHILIIAGMYKEAIDILQNIDRSALPDYLLDYYYRVYNDLYESMLKYTIVEKRKKEYRAKAMQYKDSILLRNPDNIYVQVDKLLEVDANDQALKLVQRYFNNLDAESHDVAISAYVLSDIYRRLGKREDEKQYLIVSSISDMKNGIKEYISLRRLAVILYEESDFNRAYTYMSRSLDDATFCNARLRTIEVTQTLPIIEHAYQIQIKNVQRRMQIALVCISILMVFFIFLVIYLRRAYQKLSKIRNELNDANSQLQQLNTELNTINEQLHASNQSLNETNQSLLEADRIKEIYITKFMTECSAYIDKMDDYRKTLNRTAASGKIETLYKMLKSNSFIDDEIEYFYKTFDETFLHLFPSFIQKFNELFLENDKIAPKKNKCLTTELRIFALIRLGFSDSERIASFLRCSKATVYSYRSRFRLKSQFPEIFEERIMEITAF